MRTIFVQTAWLLSLGILAGLFSILGGHAPAPWSPAPVRASADAQGIRIYEARALVPLWVDARSATAYAENHIPGAIHLDEVQWDLALATVLENWDGKQAIVVYCESLDCGTSADIAERLKEALGFSDVHSLRGGWAAWEADTP